MREACRRHVVRAGGPVEFTDKPHKGGLRVKMRVVMGKVPMATPCVPKGAKAGSGSTVVGRI